MLRNTAFALLVLGFAAGAARADMYRCEVPGSSSPLYTNDPRDTHGKKCTVVSHEINVVPAPGKPAAKPTPKSFPKESSTARASAKERQREILEKELGREEEMLDKARKALEDQEAVRYGNEKNYARVLERLQPYKDNVEVHQKNVEALKRELRNLDR
ncbi:MAG TPA: hypothetical protein VKA16_04190 [Burkholderiales bacterium]|nr:hypothetical protein [Burkholderiales bacterium]